MALSAAIAAFLRAVEAQPVRATEDMPFREYEAAEMRKRWAGNLAAEVERQDALGERTMEDREHGS